MEGWFHTGPRFQQSRVRILILLNPVLTFFAATSISLSFNGCWVRPPSGPLAVPTGIAGGRAFLFSPL